MASTTDRRPSESPTARELLESALAQVRHACRLYNLAIASYNTHLENHRDRRDLHDLPFRAPITAHDAFVDAINGDPGAIDALLTHLIDQAHLDSELRRHPRTFPIHLEATEHLQTARDCLITILEEALHHIREIRD